MLALKTCVLRVICLVVFGASKLCSERGMAMTVVLVSIALRPPCMRDDTDSATTTAISHGRVVRPLNSASKYIDDALLAHRLCRWPANLEPDHCREAEAGIARERRWLRSN